mmetsp:Transcript_14902/g.62826  ORF Transcript_14902/g.62826 Transcript_14902/m.62826 type:complete len:210 (-) Transcript_14902:726-1355(-)
MHALIICSFWCMAHASMSGAVSPEEESSMRGKGTPLSQCANRTSRTNLCHRIATARTLPNCMACSATLASRLSGGALFCGVGNRASGSLILNFSSSFASFAASAPVSGLFAGAFRPGSRLGPPVSNTSRSTSCTTLSGGTRGGTPTPNPSSTSYLDPTSSQYSGDASRDIVSAPGAARTPPALAKSHSISAMPTPPGPSSLPSTSPLLS